MSLHRYDRYLFQAGMAMVLLLAGSGVWVLWRWIEGR
jgi:hypothetical protein